MKKFGRHTINVQRPSSSILTWSTVSCDRRSDSGNVDLSSSPTGSHWERIEGGREREKGRKGEKKGGREGERERGREEERERGREGGKEGEKEGGRKGGREGGRKGGRERNLRWLNLRLNFVCTV